MKQVLETIATLIILIFLLVLITGLSFIVYQEYQELERLKNESDYYYCDWEKCVYTTIETHSYQECFMNGEPINCTDIPERS